MPRKRLIVQSILSLYLASTCTWGHAKSATHKSSIQAHAGLASYYSDRFQGRRTANGERFDQRGFTAMHRSLPFGTRLRVTNVSNKRSIEVRVNDRCRSKHGPALDLSRRAAEELGFLRSGLARVTYEVVEPTGEDG
ncbi:MAG: septal ring lytic transglycosylase RlpA family protein [Methylococcaceae bacterium]